MLGGVWYVLTCVVCGVVCGVPSFLFLRAGGVLFKMRTQYQRVLGIKKRIHGTRKQGKKRSIFEAKMAPKMDPGGFQKRVHKPVGN